MASAVGSPRNLLTSLILVFPLFLVYQVGVLFTWPNLNGADFLTVALIASIGLSKAEYLLVLFLVGVGFLIGVSLLRRRQRFHGRVLLPVLAESILYAVSMGSLIGLLMTRVLGFSPSLATGAPALGGDFVSRVVMSLGAGVHEEAVFRLGMFSGGVAALSKFGGMARFWAVLWALLLSSLAFGLAHHIPPHGDPLTLGILTFRVLAGVLFGVLFWFRGLAVAVYTHALYDLYVLLLRN